MQINRDHTATAGPAVPNAQHTWGVLRAEKESMLSRIGQRAFYKFVGEPTSKFEKSVAPIKRQAYRRLSHEC